MSGRRKKVSLLQQWYYKRKIKAAMAGSVPFLLNPNDHSTPLSFTVQTNSTGTAEGGNRGREMRRPLDLFWSWNPSIFTFVVKVVMGA